MAGARVAASVMCAAQGLSNDGAAGQSSGGAGSNANRGQLAATGMAIPANTGASRAEENTGNLTASPCRPSSSTNRQTPCTTSSPAASNRATGTQAGAASTPTPQSSGSASYKTGGGPDMAQNSPVPNTCPGQGADPESKRMPKTGSRSNQIRCRSSRIQIDSFLLRDSAP